MFRTYWGAQFSVHKVGLVFVKAIEKI